MSRLVNTLVEQGWVERSVNPHNRREVLLQLTDTGRAVAEEVHRSASAKYRVIWDRLSDTQRAQILDGLATLNAVLRESNESKEVQQ